MASLNLSANGPSIRSSYQGVVDGQLASSGSPTHARWALFTVQAPLASAFQDSGSKESVLRVENTGEGELADLVEDLNDGRIQFAFVKVKDPNTGLPKNVLIDWCGGGVPERTKGYFTSHVNAVGKILHGYHVEITARSDGDLAPESIIQKVSDASGAKYTARGPSTTSGPPPVAKKPVFTPTTSSSGSSFNPLVAARNRRQENVDADGWGTDAPQVTRTQLEKVESAYKPTKVNMAELTRQRDEPSKFAGSSARDDGPSDVVRGGYQPVGKVDIAALRAQAQRAEDDRPTIVKGAYEPVGKVDIAAIRARAQRPSEAEPDQAADEPPKPLAERSAAFSQSERLTTLPKPRVANKFGGSSTFTGTKAPTPGGLGFGASPAATTAPVASTSRTFADQGGKTPAQIWAEKKAKQGGVVPAPVQPTATSPVTAQKSGEWKSGYSGKSWAPVQTPAYGRGASEVEQEQKDESQAAEAEEPASESGGVSALRDRFKGAQPMGGAAPISRGISGHEEEDDEPAPPPPPMGTRPAGAFAIPGLPTRPAAQDEQEPEEEEEAAPAHEDYEEEREQSPVRIAVPVSRGPEPALEPPAERNLPRPVPTHAIEEELPREDELPAEEETHDPRAAAAAVAHDSFGHDAATAGHGDHAGGKRAVVQYDYEKAEDNEIELHEGEYVTNIDMVDDDWWMGTNAKGESGLFPSNYVELVEDVHHAAPATHAAVPPPPAPAAEPEPEHEHAADGGATATAQFDYEAAEDNELSFPEGAKVTKLEFPDEDWWFGHYQGKSGLFPANYVVLDS